MPGATVERTLWIIATIIIAALVIFGVIYPYVVSLSTGTVDFGITEIEAYDNGFFSFRIKNLASQSIIKLKITITCDSTNYTSNTWYVGLSEEYATGKKIEKVQDNSLNLEGVSIPPGTEVQIYTTGLTSVSDDSSHPKVGKKLSITIYALFSGGNTVTHQYTVRVRKA